MFQEIDSWATETFTNSGSVTAEMGGGSGTIHIPYKVNLKYKHIHYLKVHKQEIFFNTFFAETETIWSQGPVTRDF